MSLFFSRASAPFAVVFLATVFGLALAACQQPAGEAGALTDDEVSALEEAVASYQDALRANDWRAYAGHFAEDGVAMPPNGETLEGREAILSWAEGFSVGAFEATTVEIDGRSGLAYHRGTFSIRITPPGMDEAVPDEGKFVEIWERQPDGQWLLAVDIWNSSQPPTPPQGAME